MAKVLKFARLLDTPKTMGTALDALVIEPNLVFGIPDAGDGMDGAMTRQAMVDAVTSWKAAFTAGKIVLFTNTVSPGPGLTFAMLAEPVGDWYAEQASALGAVYIDENGKIRLTAASKQFTYSGTDDPEQIKGWGYIDETA